MTSKTPFRWSRSPLSHSPLPHLLSNIPRRTLNSAKGSAGDSVLEFRAWLQPGPSHSLGHLWDSPDVLSQPVLFWCVHFLIRSSSHYSPFPPKLKDERKERSPLLYGNSGNLKWNLFLSMASPILNCFILNFPKQRALEENSQQNKSVMDQSHLEINFMTNFFLI